MQGYASTSDDFSRRVEEWMDTASSEVRHAVRYIDAAVIPEVRHEVGGALRLLAGHMERWADKLDPDGKRGL